MFATRAVWVSSLVAVTAFAGPQPEVDAMKEFKKVSALKGDVFRGKARYEVVCASCHVEDGGGQSDGTYPQLAGQHPAVVLKQLADLRAGARDIPVMKEAVKVLTPQDLADIAVYLRLIPIPRNNGRGDGAALEEGRLLYQRNCQSCHGFGGEGDAKTMTPVLAGQHFKYLLRQATDIRDGKRKNASPAMMEAIKGASDAQLVAVADFMSRLVTPKLPKTP
jgi:cytochrome c553